MNFFEAQDQARRTIRWLIVLFTLAVVSLIILTELLFIFVFYYANAPADQTILSYSFSLDPGFHITVITIVLMVTGIGALSKSYQLRKGGYVIATMMDGRLIASNSDNLRHKVLLNVVEEMAIASGVPVPQVFVMENERSINAFAAGMGTDDAAICVTQGMLEALDRDALQGVIGHEFSHILNGDMRINSIVTSILYGILVLGLMGSRMLRFISFRSRGSSRRSGSGIAGIAAIAIGLMVIGFGGSFFGGLIKAMVNRQREYLADASAVQFTRSKTGISSALKMIGGYSYGSELRQSHSAELSHFFFATGVASGMQALFASHPPLGERIRRLEPDWNGEYPKVETSYTQKTMSEELADGAQQTVASKPTAMAFTMALTATLERLEDFNQLNGNNDIDHAHQLLGAIPEVLKSAARDPFLARSLILAMLLSADADERQHQCQIVAQLSEPGVDTKLLAIHTILMTIGREYYLPLVSLAMPALRSCSAEQVKRFIGCVNRVMRVDNHVSLFEWCLMTVIKTSIASLVTSFNPRLKADRKIAQLHIQVRVILSLLAHAESSTESERIQTYESALNYLQMPIGVPYTPYDLRFEVVDNALGQLDRLNPMDKQRLISACLVIIQQNKTITIEELEVFRAIATALHSPLPPVILAKT